MWYQDCGASQHMTPRREWFTNLVEIEQRIVITIGDGTQVEGVGVGNVDLEAFNGENWYPVTLQDVLYVPKLGFNLFSVGQILDKGFSQRADKDTSQFESCDDRSIRVIAKRKGHLYKVLLR